MNQARRLIPSRSIDDRQPTTGCWRPIRRPLLGIALLVLIASTVPLPPSARASQREGRPTLFGEILASQNTGDGKTRLAVAKKAAPTHHTEAKRREADAAAVAKVLASPAVQHALADARASFWQGKFIDAEKHLLTLERSTECRIPECDALLARVAMQKDSRVANLVAAGLHSSATIDASPIPPEHREAALVCLRANLMLAMQPSLEAAQLLAKAPKTPAFQGVPFVGDTLAFAHAADWSALHALADRIAADGNGSKDPVVQLHQIEAALLAGDALVLCNRWDDAKEAYVFAISEGKGHNQRTQHQADYANTELRSPIPGPLIAEAQGRLAQLNALDDVKRLSLAFLRYREAESHRLAGRLKEAIAGYDLLLKEADAPNEAALTAAKETATKNKRRFDVEAFVQDPESPFEAATICYRAKCKLQLGDERNTRAIAR